MSLRDRILVAARNRRLLTVVLPILGAIALSLYVYDNETDKGSLQTGVADITNRITKVERVCRSECRQEVARRLLRLMTDDPKRSAGGDAQPPSQGSQQPGPPPSGPTPQPPSGNPPNPPSDPPNPPNPPNPPDNGGPVGDVLDEACELTSPLGICLN